MNGYYIKSQKSSERESIITAIPFICDSNASDIHLHQLITTQKKIVRIITFSSYSSHTQIIFNQLNILPFKHLLFLRIGLQMFKYESGQLPDALNMFFC